MARKRSENPAYATTKSTKPKTCIAYARCSTKQTNGQTAGDQSDSITDQVTSFHRIVKRFNLEWNEQVFQDDGIPGWQRRDGLENLIEAPSQQRGADALVIRSLSRLTRLQPLDGANLLAKLRGLGIVAIYTEDAGEITLPEPDDAWGWAKLVMDSGVTHSQSRTTSYNVAQAMLSQLQRSVADAGKQPPWSESKVPRKLKVTSAPPYGYRDVKSGTKPNVMFQREFDPELAPIAQRILKLFLSGKSACSIAAMLNQEGLRTRRGSMFSDDSIDEMLTNRAYVGEFVRLRKGNASFHHCLKSGVLKIPDAARKGRPNSKPAQVENDASEQISLADCWQPMLSQREFAKIQSMLVQRAKRGSKARKASGALSCGIAKCGHCQRRLRLGRFKQGVTYFCPVEECGVGGCDRGGHVREDLLLPQLMREITKALGKETARLETCLATPTVAPKPTAAVDKQIAQLSAELDASNATLVRLMKRSPAPVSAIDMAADAIEKQSAELAKLRSQRQQMAKLPAAQEGDIRERLEWLTRHAVTLRACNITPPNGDGTTDFQLDDPAWSPYTSFTMLGDSPTEKKKGAAPMYKDGTRFQTARLHFDAERLRNLCHELGLSVTIQWEGKRGDSRRGHRRNATATFAVNSYPVASKESPSTCSCSQCPARDPATASPY